jgi:transcription elongation GreA/GreB family factor
MRDSITDLLYQRGIDDEAARAVADEADYRIRCLESRLADLEEKLRTAKIILARMMEIDQIADKINHGRGCVVCGALGDEPCDAGIHR